jgi:lycopene cyclase domain-containing protein
MKFAYLIIDTIVLGPPLLFSFSRTFPFSRQWKTYWPAILHVALIFLVWDAWFTHLGVWGFNPRYVTGLRIANLPVEELLFFICIPYACLFTGFCWSRCGLNGPNKKTTDVITLTLVAVLLTVGCWNLSRRYTASTFISMGILLALCRYSWRITWLGKFYVLWLALLLPLLVVDGLLTGTGFRQPIVWYNAREIWGIRVITIPVEDFFYGMELLLLNVLAAGRWDRMWQQGVGRPSHGFLS